MIAHSDTFAADITADHDRKNLADIDKALADREINEEAAEYLRVLYSDGMDWFREVFHVLGKCLGAPKAPVVRYDYDNDSGIDEKIKISDINPLSPYLVQHRLDMDPMRNQFFTITGGHKIDLSVSSIVTVIVAAQKSLSRSLEKITGKYYHDYIEDVATTAERVISAHEREASGRAIADKIREEFSNKFITAASETVLKIIGRGHEHIAVDLVRELDKVEKPHLRLQDVWRVKCLFDLVPQARTFMERIREAIPERIISMRDKFYDMDNPRNYRDAKVILNIGPDSEHIVPMEIICQVRTFFEFERLTHNQYERARRRKNAASDEIERKMADYYEEGVKQYNLMICDCVEDLFDRVGWNILYSRGMGMSLFEGFPKNCTLYYPQKMLDIITDKLDNAIENEVFRLTTLPANLTKTQKSEIFHFMARFILVAAMPYRKATWSAPTNTTAGKLFNFVMKEVQRYYKQ
ncbi:MAG: hypothetical protein J6Y49_02145 [Alphaproteobacteria bacterium]|nr:hypothetical protein [Alphaproteobacteria bacterium]